MKKVGKGIALTVLSACLLFNTAFADSFVSYAAETDMTSGLVSDISREDQEQSDNYDNSEDDQQEADPADSNDTDNTSEEAPYGSSEELTPEELTSEESTPEESTPEEEPTEELIPEEAISEDDLIDDDAEMDESVIKAVDNQVGDNITYTFSNGVLTLKGTGATYDYDDSNKSPFKSLTGIKSIVVGEGITVLGTEIFGWCGDHSGNHGTSITRISLPSSLRIIRERAFQSIYASEADISVPSSVTTVGKCGLAGYFRNVEFQSGTSSIADYAMAGSIVTGVFKFPSSLESIGDYAFHGITVHNDVTLPAGLKYLGKGAFSGYKSNTIYFTGNLPTISDDAFSLDLSLSMSQLDYYLIAYYPADNSTWSEAALASLRSRFTDVDFRPNGGSVSNKCGDNITWSISNDTLKLSGSGPMYDYSANNRAPWSDRLRDFKTISFDNNITTIGDFAFYGVLGLGGHINVTLPSKLTRVGKFAFYNVQPKGVNLPSGVTYIGDYAFGKNVFMTTNGFKLSSETTYIGDGAFESCTDAVIEIPKFNRITYIGDGAFCNCQKLTGSLNFPETLKYIGDSAFSNCAALKAELHLPTGLTYLGKEAFGYTRGITGDIVIPEAITRIGTYTFANNAISSVKIGNKVTIIDQNAFSECTSLKQVTLGNSVQTIAFYAFTNCKLLTELELPATVTRLDMPALAGTGIKKIVFKGDMPKRVSYLSSGQNLQKNIEIYYPRAEAGWYTLTDAQKAKALDLTAFNPVFVPYGDAHKCVVTFVDYDDESKTLLVQEVDAGECVQKPTNIEVEGKSIFNYYYNKPGSSGKTAFDFDIQIFKDLTIYVLYHTRTCNVYFDPCNGGEVPYYSYNYGDEFSNPYTRPDNWEGHYFVGWSKTPVPVGQGGERVDLSQPIVMKEDITFYAIWLDQERITINLNAYTDDYPFTQDTVYASALATLPYETAPWRSGYNFCGWYYDEAFTQKAEQGDPLSVPVVNLYAKWERIMVKVFFDASASDNLESFTVDVPLGEHLKEPDVKPVKAGQIFEGWFEEGRSYSYYFDTSAPYYDMTLRARFYDPNEDFGDVDRTVRNRTGYMHVDQLPKLGWVYCGGTYKYSGKAIVPSDIRVFYYNKRLTEGKDYTYKLKDNVKPGYGKIIVTFKGGYSGTVEGSFYIGKVNIQSAFNSGDLQVGSTDLYLPYNGKAQKGKTTLKMRLNGKLVTLKEGTDFEYYYPSSDNDKKISGDDVLKKPGTYTITIQGKNNYESKITITETITELIPMSSVKVSGVKNLTCTGNDLTQPSLTVKYGKKTLEEGKDFTVSYSNNKEIGTARITIEAKEGSDFAGTKVVTFNINGTPLSKMYFAGFKSSMSYNQGKNVTQDVKIYTSAKAANAQDESALLVEGEDYSIKYEGNTTVAGKVTMVFTGMGKYSGVVKKTFKIVPATLKGEEGFHVLMNVDYERDLPKLVKTQTASVVAVVFPEYRYQKNGTKPKPAVYYKNKNGVYSFLDEGTDYTCTYGKNNKIGSQTGSIKITLKGNFKGTAQAKFDINKGNFGLCTFNVSDVKYKKVKGNCKPVVSVVDARGTKLASGKDYTLSIEYPDGTVVDQKREIVPENTDLYAVFRPAGNYEFTDDKTSLSYRFKVYGADRDINSAKVIVSDRFYEGQPIILDDSTITVIMNGKALTLGNNESDCDYRIVTYKNNEKVGTAKVTIQGCGKYSGTRTVSFKILRRNLEQ